MLGGFLDIADCIDRGSVNGRRSFLTAGKLTLDVDGLFRTLWVIAFTRRGSFDS